MACVPAFAQTEIGQLNMELSPDFAIQARKIEERIAIISIDVETCEDVLSIHTIV